MVFGPLGKDRGWLWDPDSNWPKRMAYKLRLLSLTILPNWDDPPSGSFNVERPTGGGIGRSPEKKGPSNSGSEGTDIFAGV